MYVCMHTAGSFGQACVSGGNKDPFLLGDNRAGRRNGAPSQGMPCRRSVSLPL